MHRTHSLRLSIFILLAASACGGTQTTASSSETEPKVEEQITNMHSHFDDINKIQLSLISGNLLEAQNKANAVSRSFSGQSPANWSPFINRILKAAESIKGADTLKVAAREAATMAATCGSCHQSQGVIVVNHQAVPPPNEEDRFSNFMVQHRWATDRLWEGLIGPSDEAWKAGAKVLATTELNTEDVDERLIVTEEIVELIARMRSDAAQAGDTNTLEAREQLYGSFLSSCAGCHLNMQNQRD